MSGGLDSVRASGYTVIKAALVVFRDALFLFTYDLQSGDVWRSPDGEHWDSVSPSGWLSGNARGVNPGGAAVFHDQLYFKSNKVQGSNDGQPWQKLPAGKPHVHAALSAGITCPAETWMTGRCASSGASRSLKSVAVTQTCAGRIAIASTTRRR